MIGSLFSYIGQDTNEATLSGCIDIIVVQQPNNELKSGPFHIRFGTLQVLDQQNNVVKIKVNDILVPVEMKLNNEGAAYFEEKVLSSQNQQKKDKDQINKSNSEQIQSSQQQQNIQSETSSTINQNQIKKSLRPSSDILKQFNLHKGSNKIEYLVESKVQGLQTLEGRLYLFDPNIKIVVSDIDGTITKSDVLGHVLTFIGKDWTHQDICQLFQNIQQNGYQLVYLSARPITQYMYTKKYIQNIKQGEYLMPDGPILMSPDLMFSSFKREIVYRTADQFKGALLKDIQKLFPQQNSLFAGFGNRMTDATACLFANIQKNNIYIIDEKSIIQQMGNPEPLSYFKIQENINNFFPKLTQ